jgi:hypothetical protein
VTPDASTQPGPRRPSFLLPPLGVVSESDWVVAGASPRRAGAATMTEPGCAGGGAATVASSGGLAATVTAPHDRVGDWPAVGRAGGGRRRVERGRHMKRIIYCEEKPSTRGRNHQAARGGSHVPPITRPVAR